MSRSKTKQQRPESPAGAPGRQPGPAAASEAADEPVEHAEAEPGGDDFSEENDPNEPPAQSPAGAPPDQETVSPQLCRGDVMQPTSADCSGAPAAGASSLSAPPPPAPARTTAVPVTWVTLHVPITKPLTRGGRSIKSFHVDTMLNGKQDEALRKLAGGLAATMSQLENERLPRTKPDCVRWLLDEIGKALAREMASP